MLATVNRKDLLEGLALMSRVASTKSTLPQLRTMLIRAGDEGLRLSATDLELGAEMRVPAKVEKHGAVAVDAERGAKLLSSLGEGELVFSGNAAGLLIKRGQSRYEMAGLRPEEFPLLPEPSASRRVSVPAAALKSAARQVVHACSDDCTRPVYTGVSLTLGKDALRLQAMDVTRMCLRDLALREAYEPFTLIAPRAFMAEMGRLLPDTDEAVTLEMGANLVGIRGEAFWLSSRVIDGSMPDCSRLLSAAAPIRVTVNRADLLEIAKRARLAVLDLNKEFPRVTLAAADDALRIWARGEAFGLIRETLSAEVEGGPITWRVNANFLIPALQAHGEECITFELSAPESNIRIPSADRSLIALMAPMQLRSGEEDDLGEEA